MKKELWIRLRTYHFDNLVAPHLSDRVASTFGGPDAFTRAFAKKLARKLGWKPAFALRAIGEYKKFVYLGNVATFSVTPPKIIDQVWHEHLLFSRAYREFCRDVLGRDFDHNPELLMLDAQIDVYHAQYDATLALYASEFHHEPPADIWGTTKFGVRERRPDVLPQRSTGDDSSTYVDDTPLYMLFSSGDAGSTESAFDFGGGGGFSGGGGGSSWGDSSDTSSDSGSDSSGDSGDSGGSDGGSSCSSSCGSSD